MHAPEVECISKGKSHKKYEFGCKVSIVSSANGNFILGAMAYHGNPYDGHTLQSTIEQTKTLLPKRLRMEHVYVDRGYRGAKLNDPDIQIHTAGKRPKKRNMSLRRWSILLVIQLTDNPIFQQI